MYERMSELRLEDVRLEVPDFWLVFCELLDCRHCNKPTVILEKRTWHEDIYCCSECGVLESDPYNFDSI